MLSFCAAWLAHSLVEKLQDRLHRRDRKLGLAVAIRHQAHVMRRLRKWEQERRVRRRRRSGPAELLHPTGGDRAFASFVTPVAQADEHDAASAEANHVDNLLAELADDGKGKGEAETAAVPLAISPPPPLPNSVNRTPPVAQHPSLEELLDGSDDDEAVVDALAQSQTLHS